MKSVQLYEAPANDNINVGRWGWPYDIANGLPVGFRIALQGARTPVLSREIDAGGFIRFR
jgi:hypothetical protein